ncbi:MAG: hypothetical protein ACD_9C00104G0004 [uncultured bacterium]|nr:MAG: hypothetical protein ACD_9C00104G0004 [uncultured bacterium]
MATDEIANLVQATADSYGYNCSVIDFALDTTILHLDDNNNTETLFVFPFLGRKIIWTNPIQDNDGHYAQRVRIDWVDQVGFSDYGIVMKFLSAVCFLADGIVLDVLFNASGPFPGPRCSRKVSFSCLNGYGIDFLLRSVDWGKILDSDWAKLAYYRQGVNSRSSHLAFLSFRNILEVHFKRNHDDIKKYINEEIEKIQNFEEWKMKNGSNFYRKLKDTRHKSAHVLLNNDPLSQVQNPDNPIEYIEMNENKLIIKTISEKIINSCLYKN